MDYSDIKLIATDIDGTLLRSDRSLAPRVNESLNLAKDAGIHVVPATGRPIMVAQEVIDSFDCPDYWIFANGAITYDATRDRIMRGFWISQSSVRWVATELRKAIPGVQFAVELERSSVFEENFRKVLPQDPESYGSKPVRDVLEHLDGRIQKLLAFKPDLDMSQLFSRINSVVGDQAVASFSGMEFVELSASLVTKAHALQALTEQLGLSAANVAAFGDNHNDIPMLKWARYSYAMGNASADAKIAAQRVIGSNDDDGLAAQVDEIVRHVEA